MLPAWASWPSPTPEPHQGFASSAAVALVFFVLGVLIPRPKWLNALSSTRAMTFFSLASSPAGLVFRRVALAFHGFALVRELWCALTVRGTFSRIRRAAWQFLKDPRGGFVLPPRGGVAATAGGSPSSSLASSPSRRRRRTPGIPDDSWHVTERDLHAFRAAVEAPESLKSWGEPMLVKDFGTMTYKAWRRSLPDGKTEYKSVTVAMDSTAEEFSDFFLDDNARGGVRTGDDQGSGWDPMICDHESLEEDASSVAAVAGRRQVVRWRRSFPFAFLSDREYCIARRCWRCPDDDEGAIYTATKTIADHPRMLEIQRARSPGEKVVAMDVFYSVWRSRTIPCPSGDPGAPPACETLLLHREDFKIPENLARFAVKAGMAGFVKKMAPAVRAFVQERRSRGVSPRGHDALAYGVPEAWAVVSKREKVAPLGRALPPPPPEAATFFALSEDGGGEEEEGAVGGASSPAAALPPSSFAAAARPASTPSKAPASLRASVSFAQLPPSFSVSRRASQEGPEEGARQEPASFALSEMSEELSSQSSSSSQPRGAQGPRLRRAAVSAPQLSSLGSMLASAAQDFADLLPARVGRAVGAALGSPLLGNSPPESPKKGEGEGGEEEATEPAAAAAAASASAAADLSSSVRSASPSPSPSLSHHHAHRPSSHHPHHGHSHSHHHHHVGRGRRRGPPGGGSRARSPPAAAAATAGAPASSSQSGVAAAAALSHPHHHHRSSGGSPPLAADLLRAGVAVAVAVAVASRAGRAAGRAEARAELAKLRKRQQEEEEAKAALRPRLRRRSQPPAPA